MEMKVLGFQRDPIANLHRNFTPPRSQHECQNSTRSEQTKGNTDLRQACRGAFAQLDAQQSSNSDRQQQQRGAGNGQDATELGKHYRFHLAPPRFIRPVDAISLAVTKAGTKCSRCPANQSCDTLTTGRLCPLELYGTNFPASNRDRSPVSGSIIANRTHAPRHSRPFASLSRRIWFMIDSVVSITNNKRIGSWISIIC